MPKYANGGYHRPPFLVKYQLVITNIQPDIFNNTTNSAVAHQSLVRWNNVQDELIPDIADQVGSLTPKLEKLIHVLDWTRFEKKTKGSE